MEELIKEAESLYWQIDKVVWNLIATRENKDDEGKKKAISDMETAMCGTQQFLKCILERKDNIVDLGEVWHKNDTIPDEGKQLLAIRIDGEACEGDYQPEWESEDKTKHLPAGLYCSNIPIWMWSSIKYWAYIKDLLPKGDNK